jgi:hypothetical protein
MRAHIVLAHPEPPTVPFSRMADWGSDSHKKPDAPVYSPFMRHEK